MTVPAAGDTGARWLQMIGVAGIPEVAPGNNIATLLLDAVAAGALGPGGLADGDVVVVTSKVVSKAEGRIVPAADREAAITSETVRLVATRGETRIVQTHHGFVMAAAGVDASNTRGGTVLLLPLDPDATARRIRADLRRASGRVLAVVVTDTAGRPWRNGLVDFAIGAAGLTTAVDYRGQTDGFGNRLELTVMAVADEIAAAADLVKGKLSGVPVAVLRGLGHLVTPEDGPGVRTLIRSCDDDMFWLGTREALEQGREEARQQPRSAPSSHQNRPSPRPASG